MCKRRWPRAEDLVLVCASERVIRGLVVGLALLLDNLMDLSRSVW
jgi:hypothetical protein